jgi:hypothetical protein
VGSQPALYLTLLYQSTAESQLIGLKQTAKENGIAFRAIHIESKEEAQNAPTPITNYALFRDGEYITNEQILLTFFGLTS